MPHYDFRLAAVLQALENGLWLAEALFFPAFSSCGEEPEFLLDTLQRHARRVVKATPPLDLHRLHLGDNPQPHTVALTLEPPRRAVAWRRPLELSFPAIQWAHGNPAEACIAFLPTLGIEVVAASAEDLERILPGHVRAALLRVRAATSLERLVWLQRCRAVEVRPTQFTAQVRTPRQTARAEQERSERRNSVLKEVATELKGAELPRAYEMDVVVSRLADALTGRNPRSVLLVGPSGVGKTAAVLELARRRADLGLGTTPLWSTSGSRLVAGMSGFGMWEERCQEVWREAAKARAILHLGNLMELMEVGKSEYHDHGIATFFRPYLARGDLLAIAECTPEQVPLIEQQDPHLLEVFYQVKVEEPGAVAGQAILARYAEAASAAAAATGPLAPEALAELDRLHRRYATYSAYPGHPLRFLKNLLNDRAGTTAITVPEVIRVFARETGLPLFLLEDAVRLDLTQTLELLGAAAAIGAGAPGDGGSGLRGFHPERFQPTTGVPCRAVRWYNGGRRESHRLIGSRFSLTPPPAPICVHGARLSAMRSPFGRVLSSSEARFPFVIRRHRGVGRLANTSLRASATSPGVW